MLVQMLLVRLFTIDFLIHTAETVLKEYRDRFVKEMDASTVVSDFVYHGIIPDGVQESIAKAYDPRQRNSTLHDCLLKTCTNEALKTACGIITSVQGNPRMSALGKDMQRKLESGLCTCVFACVCVCVLLNTHHMEGLHSRFSCQVSPPFMFTLWSHCYDTVLHF